jgi:hypothetical protein
MVVHRGARPDGHGLLGAGQRFLDEVLGQMPVAGQQVGRPQQRGRA